MIIDFNSRQENKNYKQFQEFITHIEKAAVNTSIVIVTKNKTIILIKKGDVK